MRKIIALALLAIPIVVLLTLPIRVVLPWLDAPEALTQPRGTVWSGSARWNQPEQPPLNLTWRFAGADWRWRASDGQTNLSGRWRPGQALIVRDLVGELELARIDLAYWLLGSNPAGYLALDIGSAHLVAGEVPRVSGRAVWEEAWLHGAIHEPLGRIAIELRPGPDSQLAIIRSLEPAPLSVEGSFEADAERYQVELLLAASPDRPDVDIQLAGLGERLSDGRVRIRQSGVLGWQ